MPPPSKARPERPIIAYFRRIGGGSLLVSVGLHLAILLWVLMWVVHRPADPFEPPGGGQNGSSQSDGREPEQAVPPAQTPVEVAAAPDRVVVESLHALVNVPVSFDLTANFAPPVAASAPQVPAAASLGSGGGQGGGIGLGIGSGIGAGPNFFGMHTGNKVVIVVDISGSMDQGAIKYRSYHDLLDEIARTIRNFDPKTQFGLLAFSTDVRYFKSEMSAADPGTKEDAVQWAKGLEPDGYTRADLAFTAAFAMNPSTIIFVSDGEPNFPGIFGPKAAERVLQIVRELQSSRPSPVIIDAIAYFALDGQQFMQTLAQQNGGAYRELQ